VLQLIHYQYFYLEGGEEYMNLKKLTLGIVATSLLLMPMGALANDTFDHVDPLGEGPWGGGIRGNPDDNAAKAVGFGFTPKLEGVESDKGLVDSIIAVINALLVLAAIAAVVFMIIGGVRYVTSQGDEDAVEQAKNTVIYAIIGIIVIILAAVIVNFFISSI